LEKPKYILASFGGSGNQRLKGENHGFDFFKLIFKCAPKLKRVTIKLEKRMKSFSPGGCAKKIYSISLEYPSVNFYVYLGCGRLAPHP
jgi:hypothetical protein